MPAPAVFTNNASVHAVGTPDPRPNNDNASVDTQVVAGADLTTSIAANPTPASTDGSVVFTVKAQNLGPDAATGAKVVIALPTGFTYASPSAPAGWSCTDSGLTVTCTRAGTFATGANDDLLITATAPSTPGSVTAAADISSTSPSDPNDATHGTNNNHASTTFNVLANGGSGADQDQAGENRDDGRQRHRGGGGQHLRQRHAQHVDAEEQRPQPDHRPGADRGRAGRWRGIHRRRKGRSPARHRRRSTRPAVRRR
jgi:uncharacterized repeat protein (TIGR01451 family)